MGYRALSPGKDLSDHLFFATRPSRRYRLRVGGAGLVAVRKEPGGRFLVSRVILGGLPPDADFDDPESLARALWWGAAGANPAVFEPDGRRRS